MNKPRKQFEKEICQDCPDLKDCQSCNTICGKYMLWLEKKNMRLEKELNKAHDFIIWLTPCGECAPPPTYELIGKEACKIMNAGEK